MENICFKSILSKISFNEEYICYYINPNNVFGILMKCKINNADKMDIYSVLLIIVYHSKNSIKFEYKEIKRHNNIIKFNLKFMNQIQSKEIFFNRNIKIQDFIKDIIKNFFTGNDIKISLAINRRIVSESQYLYEVANFSKDILVVDYKNN